MGKAASMNPGDLGAGGNTPDGRYVIIKAQTIRMDTQFGEKAAVEFVKRATDGTEYSDRYTAGPTSGLVPSEDGTQLVHPTGGDAIISKQSNFGKFLKAIGGAGMPVADMGTSVECFIGTDADYVNQAQPKQAGQDEKSLSLPTKYYGKAGKSAPAKARPTPIKAAASAPTTRPTSSAAPAAVAASNGDVESQAVEQIVAALTAAEGTLTRQQLGKAVTTEVAKQKSTNPGLFKNLIPIVKLVSDGAWLETQGEATGKWLVADDQIVAV